MDAAIQSSNRHTLVYAAGIIGLSTALHVVPQMLRDFVNPAWSMLVLMLIDATVVSLLIRRRGAAWAVLLFAALLGALIMTHQNVIAALPSIGLNLALAAGFGVTLRPGSTALLVRIEQACSPLALTPTFARYLRQQTAAWTLLFIVMAATSLVLIIYAPYEWWSLFVNVLTWPLFGLMFVAEWLFRRAAFPHLPAHTPLAIVAMVFAYQRQRRAPHGR